MWPFPPICLVMHDAGFLIISILALLGVSGNRALQPALRCALCIRKAAHSAGVSSINKHQAQAPLSFYGNPLEFNFQIQILGAVGSWGAWEGTEKPERERGQSWPLLGPDLTGSPCLPRPSESKPFISRHTRGSHGSILLPGNTSASPRWVLGQERETDGFMNTRQAFSGQL